MRNLFQKAGSLIDYEQTISDVRSGMRDHVKKVGLEYSLQDRGTYQSDTSTQTQYFPTRNEAWHITTSYKHPSVIWRLYNPGKFEIHLVDYRSGEMKESKVKTMPETASPEDIVNAMKDIMLGEMTPEHQAIFCETIKNLQPQAYAGGFGASKG